MITDFQREKEEIELQNIKVAKQLQVNFTNYFDYYYIILLLIHYVSQCF